MKELRVAESAGFCFGVRQAIAKAEKAAEESAPVCSMGSLIHNDRVASDLQRKGIRIIQKLEDAGKAKDGLYIREHHKAFMDEYMRLKTPLSALFAEKTPDETRPEADAEMMESVYEEIKEAADAMDISRLEEILERMEGYTLPEAEAERWKKIRHAFDQFEYEDILRYIQ